jgi:hypothetical protein
MTVEVMQKFVIMTKSVISSMTKNVARVAGLRQFDLESFKLIYESCHIGRLANYFAKLTE